MWRFADGCWRGHARTGDAAKIGGYAGKKDTLDRAIAKFAMAYAEQTERDHAALVKAIKAGRLRASSDNAAGLTSAARRDKF